MIFQVNDDYDGIIYFYFLRSLTGFQETALHLFLFFSLVLCTCSNLTFFSSMPYSFDFGLKLFMCFFLFDNFKNVFFMAFLHSFTSYALAVDFFQLIKQEAKNKLLIFVQKKK